MFVRELHRASTSGSYFHAHPELIYIRALSLTLSVGLYLFAADLVLSPHSLYCFLPHFCLHRNKMHIYIESRSHQIKRELGPTCVYRADNYMIIGRCSFFGLTALLDLRFVLYAMHKLCIRIIQVDNPPLKNYDQSMMRFYLFIFSTLM